MLILDTDHISLFQRRDPQVTARVLATSALELATLNFREWQLHRHQPRQVCMALAAGVLRKFPFFWYSKFMEQTSFELTPKQKGILATLSRKTGKSIHALLDAALEALQEHERPSHDHGATDGHETPAPADLLPAAPRPIWEIFEEASRHIPEEELARLPTDLAAQVDHYVYGLPKR